MRSADHTGPYRLRVMPVLSRSAPSALLLLVVAFGLPGCAPSLPPEAVPAPAHPLAHAVNRYREQKGLAPIAVSPSLSRVAEAHVADLEAHFRPGGPCNMHSWSSNGPWTACCYTPDRRQAACMWNKPREITAEAYAATGYEIVAYYSDAMTPAMALEIWQESAGHRAMILNTGRWSDNTWRALGAASSAHFAAVWFGEAEDLAGN